MTYDLPQVKCFWNMLVRQLSEFPAELQWCACQGRGAHLAVGLRLDPLLIHSGPLLSPRVGSTL